MPGRSLAQDFVAERAVLIHVAFGIAFDGNEGHIQLGVGIQLGYRHQGT
jgi:hypothetical protein